MRDCPVQGAGAALAVLLVIAGSACRQNSLGLVPIAPEVVRCASPAPSQPKAQASSQTEFTLLGARIDGPLQQSANEPVSATDAPRAAANAPVERIPEPTIWSQWRPVPAAFEKPAAWEPYWPLSDAVELPAAGGSVFGVWKADSFSGDHPPFPSSMSDPPEWLCGPVDGSSHDPWFDLAGSPQPDPWHGEHWAARGWENIVSDHRNYYRYETGRNLALALAMAAVVANTPLDQSIQDWYRDDIRSAGSDDFATFWKFFGEGIVWVPVFATAGLAGRMWEEYPLGSATASYAGPVSRAFLVGAPPMLFMQVALGASRPGRSPHDSRWRPFNDDKAVSGHAFIGAIPFITAARSVESPWLRGAFYAASVLPAWSRVNDDAHYFSQVCLGWYMAYLACAAVEETDWDRAGVSFTPLASPELVGMGVLFRR